MGGASNTSSTSSPCSNAVTSAAAQDCRRSVGSPLPEPVRRETLLMRPGVRRRGGPSCVFYSVRHGVPKRRQKKVQVGLARRSEEHTSELQSLLRILYAVFCLKKKQITESITH